MLEKSHISEQLIIDSLRIQYDIDVAILTCLDVGADIDASIYRAQPHNQQNYFVKVKKGRQEDVSSLITTFLCDSGIKNIIPTVKTVDGLATQSIDDFTMTVYPFVDGWNGFSCDLAEDQWLTLGKVTRQVHELKVPSSIQTNIRQESYSPQWRQGVRSFFPIINDEPRGDEIAKKLQAFMKKHQAVIHRLVNQAEQLSQMVQGHSSQFVLCHSDLHAGNVLMDNSGAIYIVDWDSPIMAPKERDLMFIGGGVGNVWNRPTECEAFYRGYGQVEVNQTLLAYYRHDRILEDIAIYCQQLLLSSEGGQDRIKWYEALISQFEPQGVVEIAFETVTKKL